MPNDPRPRQGGAFIIVHPRRGELPDQDHVLLVRHAYGERKWSLPGGGIHPGETADQIAKREGSEETSLEIEALQDVGVFKAGEFVFLFHVALYRGIVSPGDKEEIIECRFFSGDDIVRLWRERLVYPAQFKMVGYYLNHWYRWVRKSVIHDILSDDPRWPPRLNPWPNLSAGSEILTDSILLAS